MRKRIKNNVKAQLVASTVVGKEYYLSKLRNFKEAILPEKTRAHKLGMNISGLKNYDESRSVGPGTL
jgi:hypothetical protein